MNKTVRVVKTWRVVRVTYKERFTPLFGGKDWTSCFVFFMDTFFLPWPGGRSITSWTDRLLRLKTTSCFCFVFLFFLFYFEGRQQWSDLHCAWKDLMDFFHSRMKKRFSDFGHIFIFIFFFQSDVKSSFFLIFLKNFLSFVFFPDFCVFCTQWVVRWWGGEVIVFWSFCSEMLLLTPVVF